MPCPIFTALSMLVNRVFEISGELQAELVLAIMPNAPSFILLSNSVYMLLCLCNYDTGSGGSSFWRLGRRRWHHEFSEWQLMVPPVAAGLSGWRPVVFGMIHVICEIISNCEAFKLLNERKSITSMEFSESIWLYTWWYAHFDLCVCTYVVEFRKWISIWSSLIC